MKIQYYNLEPAGKTDQLSNYDCFLCPGKGTQIFNMVFNQHRTQNTQTKTKSGQETEIWGETLLQRKESKKTKYDFYSLKKGEKRKKALEWIFY